jgi:signal recognition particle receptor subunit beta
LFSVPGLPTNLSTRKLLLRGVDGIVFIADAGNAALVGNQESWVELNQTLNESGTSATMPRVLQVNKTDCNPILPTHKLAMALEVKPNIPVIASQALKEKGVFESLSTLLKLIVKINLRGQT